MSAAQDRTTPRRTKSPHPRGWCRRWPGAGGGPRRRRHLPESDPRVTRLKRSDARGSEISSAPNVPRRHDNHGVWNFARCCGNDSGAAHPGLRPAAGFGAGRRCKESALDQQLVGASPLRGLDGSSPRESRRRGPTGTGWKLSGEPGTARSDTASSSWAAAGGYSSAGRCCFVRAVTRSQPRSVAGSQREGRAQIRARATPGLKRSALAVRG